MKKRDRRLEQNKDYFDHMWQLVKESVRQLKHDNKRKVSFQKLRAQILQTSLSQPEDAARDTGSTGNNS